MNDADVQRTASNIPSQSHEPQLESLPLHACLMLIGICRRLKKEESVTSGEIEKLYHVVCEEFEEKPKKGTQRFGNIQKKHLILGLYSLGRIT